MTQKLRSVRESYILPRRICATCLQPTQGKTTGGRGTGYGTFHWDCRRDERGNLLTIPLPKPERQHA